MARLHVVFSGASRARLFSNGSFWIKTETDEKQAHSRNDLKTTERMIKTGLWQKQGKYLRLDKKIVFLVLIYGDQFFQADSALL